jgi:hypothetical protein
MKLNPCSASSLLINGVMILEKDPAAAASINGGLSPLKFLIKVLNRLEHLSPIAAIEVGDRPEGMAILDLARTS